MQTASLQQNRETSVSLKYNIGGEAAKDSEGQGEAWGTSRATSPVQASGHSPQSHRSGGSSPSRRRTGRHSSGLRGGAWPAAGIPGCVWHGVSRSREAGLSWSDAPAVFVNKQTNNDRSVPFLFRKTEPKCCLWRQEAFSMLNYFHYVFSDAY